YFRQHAAVTGANDFHGEVLAIGHFIETEQCEAGQVYGVVRMQVGDEDAAQVLHAQASFVDATSYPMTTVDEVEGVADNDGSRDAAASLRLPLGPPARSAGRPQSHDSRLQIGCCK